MARNNEIIEDILDNVDDHEKRLKTVENGIEQILELLKGNSGESPPPKSAQPNVKVEYKDLKDAVYDGMATYFVSSPQVAGGLDEAAIRKVTQICYEEYENVTSEFYDKNKAEDHKRREEVIAKRNIQGIGTIPQLEEWASEYPTEVRRVMRVIGLRTTEPDEPAADVHAVLKAWGNIMIGLRKDPELPPPTLKAWLSYRWKLFKANNRKRRGFFYVVLLLLGLLILVFINEYQSAVMDLDRTNRIFYKTVIRNEQGSQDYHEIDSLIHSNSFFKTYRTLDD